MRTYDLSMIPGDNSVVPVLMPFYSAETQNSLERGSRPYNVVEILREVFKEDFSKAIQCYMDSCPDGAAKAIGEEEAKECRLVYEDGQAARKKEVKDKYQCRHGFGAEPDTKGRLKENKLFTEDAEIWANLKKNMPESIQAAIKLILDEKGISQEKLAMRMGVSRTAWQNWCSRKMSLRHVVAVCIALDLRADICLELVRLSGQPVLNIKEHNILIAMLFETKELTVARANEIMRQEKLPPLTEGKDEEIAC